MSSVALKEELFDLAPFGPLNPLPDFQNTAYVQANVFRDESLSEEDVRYMRYGRASTLLPYLAQDGYTRERACAHPKAGGGARKRAHARRVSAVDGRAAVVAARGRARAAVQKRGGAALQPGVEERMVRRRLKPARMSWPSAY